VPYCAISNSDRGKQIGIVNGDENEQIYKYRDYQVEEWIISLRDGLIMRRTDIVRKAINEVLKNKKNKDEAFFGVLHLHGVSSLCNLLAMKRGLNCEICSIAGMFHDFWSYKSSNPINHTRLGSAECIRMMRSLGCFSNEEIELISRMVLNHSEKEEIGDEYEELLKDAEALFYHLYEPSIKYEGKYNNRLDKILRELSITK
jgi:uncharacterized protein